MNQKLCLLIVDDEWDLLEAISETCMHLGYDVLRAENAPEALELLKTKDVDVVMTDVRMRPINGFGLLEASRSLYPRVPFVLWTGFWEKDQEEKARTYERVETMTKPFSLREVQAVLEKLQLMKAPQPHVPLKGEAVSIA